MNYPLQSLIQMGVLPPVTFPTDSRYYGSSTLTYTAPNGQSFTYLARRFVPQPGAPNYATVATHTVKTGRSAGPSGRQLSWRSSDVLADLRR